MTLEETTIQVFQDDDELKVFRLLRKTDGNLNPYDLTSATIEFIVKTDASDSTALFEYTTPTEISVISATGGVFSIQFARANLATAGDYRFQLRVTQSSKRRTVAWGVLRIEDI